MEGCLPVPAGRQTSAHRSGGRRAEPSASRRLLSRAPLAAGGRVTRIAGVDRRLAMKNLRTGLICGVVSVFVLAASFIAAYIY